MPALNTHTQWCMAELACMQRQWVVVPIAHSAPVARAAFIANKTGMAAVACSAETLPRMAALLGQCSTLRLIICMDSPEEAAAVLKASPGAPTAKQLEERGKLKYWGAAEEQGIKEGTGAWRAIAFMHQPPSHSLCHVTPYAALKHGSDAFTVTVGVPPETLYSIVFTSGSTGDPKGAMFSYGGWAHEVCRPGGAPLPAVHCSFQPLSHMAERVMLPIVLLGGGEVGFHTGNIATLYEDIGLIQPTFINSVPSFFNKIYNEFTEELLTQQVSAALQLPPSCRLPSLAPCQPSVSRHPALPCTPACLAQV